MIATEVTAGPAESNGSLLPGIWRDSLRAVHRDQLRAQRSVTSMEKLYLFRINTTIATAYSKLHVTTGLHTESTASRAPSVYPSVVRHDRELCKTAEQIELLSQMNHVHVIRWSFRCRRGEEHFEE